MTILPQLERDLYDAARERLHVEDPESPPAGGPRGRPILRRLGPLLVAAGAAVVLAVAGTALVLTGNHPRGPRPMTSSRFETNWAPTLEQLLAHFAVLRRPQTAADRAASSVLGGQAPIANLARLTRLAEILPGGQRVFLTVGRPRGPYAGQTAGSYLLAAWVLSTKGGDTSVFTGPSYIPDSGYNWLPAPAVEAQETFLMSIVPDGVRAVGWVFPRSSILAFVNGNVAASRLVHAPSAMPEKVVWYGIHRHVLRTFTAGPPKRVLGGNGIAGARFGDSAPTVVTRLSRLLGPPATSLTPSACGPVESISWRGLLTAYRSGRFIGYAYGSQTPQAVPGPPLATARGLALGETVAQGSRIYGRAFRTSEQQGGTWFLSTPSGRIDGFTYSKVPPKYGDIGPQSTITSVQAGPFICAALSP